MRSQKARLSANSPSVSPGKPTMTSVVSATPGTAARISSTSAAKSAAPVGASHAPQRGVAAALQRQVEMAAEAAVDSNSPSSRRSNSQGAIEVSRSRGTAVSSSSRRDQLEEPVRAVPVGGDLDAGDDDLGEAAGGERRRTSRTTSPAGRLRCAPRVNGMMQKAQRMLQPSSILTRARELPNASGT